LIKNAEVLNLLSFSYICHLKGVQDVSFCEIVGVGVVNRANPLWYKAA
jgi:hypothetical protein